MKKKIYMTHILLTDLTIKFKLSPANLVKVIINNNYYYWHQPTKAQYSGNMT